MSAHRTIAASLRIAHQCATDARLLLDTGSRNAAYLGEQALEQIIRALATSESIHIERHDAHQLDKTLRRFPEANDELANLQALSWLEAYATTFRYSTPAGRLPRAPDDVKLAEAIESLHGIIDRLAHHFGVDLVDESSPANRIKPMRDRTIG